MPSRSEILRAHQEQKYQAFLDKREKTAIYPVAGSKASVDLTDAHVAMRKIKIEARIPIPAWLGKGPWKMVTWWSMSSHHAEYDQPARYEVGLHFAFTRKEQTQATESRRAAKMREGMSEGEAQRASHEGGSDA